jgi:hypothetical protein
VQIRLEHASLTFFRNNDLIASFTATGERAKGSAVLLAERREFGSSWTSCCWFPARSQLQTWPLTGLVVLAPSLRFLPRNLRFLCVPPIAMLATSTTAASRY